MHHAGKFFANAFALLFASGCVTGIDVGHEGHGGGTTTAGSAGGGSGTSSGTGGQMVTGASCNSPGALLCPWGQFGGPCGDGGPTTCPLPGLPPGSDQLNCVGASTGIPGTCTPGDTVLAPGDPCNNVDAPCPWNYVCDAPADGSADGICVPGNCVPSIPSPYPSAALITIDGDGPTQQAPYACMGPYNWGSLLTGEASGYSTTDPGTSSPGWLTLVGCTSPAGYLGLGSIQITVPLDGAGTTHSGAVTYMPPASLHDADGRYAYNLNGANQGPLTVTVTEMTPEVVKGTFDFVLNQNDMAPSMVDTKHLTGTFDVCRLPFHSSLHAFQFPP